MEHKAFHLSLPCYSIVETKDFYVHTLGFELGRSSTNWIDIDMAGNQLTFLQAHRWRMPDQYYQFGESVLPAFHFGLLVRTDEWNKRLKELDDQDLISKGPEQFLVDEPGAHQSFFVEDLNGYIIEFKSFIQESETFSQG